MTRADDIERDVETTRRHLDRTVDELGERMSPSRFIEDLRIALMGRDGDDTIAVVGRYVRENPTPMALVGVGMLAMGGGLLWMAMDLRHKQRRHGYVGRPGAFGDVAPPPEAVTMPGESELHRTPTPTPAATPTPPYADPQVTPTTRMTDSRRVS